MKWLWLFLVIPVTTLQNSFAQQKQVFVRPVCGDQNFVLEQPLRVDQEEIIFDAFRCYLGKFEFYLDDSLVWQDTGYHLLDISKPESFRLTSFPANLNFNLLYFNLGIDSATSVAGVLPGELDPTNGMYWSWQSGYINLKLEGKRKSGEPFQFHLGGYSHPYNSLQRIGLEVFPGRDISLTMDIAHFFELIDLNQVNKVMSPGEEAVELMHNANLMFYYLYAE